jgi:cell division protein YceG involved in septum cleavage
MLKQAGLVKNKFLFYSLAITKRPRRSIRAGEYKFNTSMTPSAIIDELLLGENKKH